MHPAEKELILGALEQVEGACRTLRRYLIIAQKADDQQMPGGSPAPRSYDSDPDLGEDQLEKMLGQILMGENRGGREDV